MPVDLGVLNASISALVDEVTATETLDQSVIQVLNGQAQAIKDAVAADQALTAAEIASISATVDTVNGRYVAAGKALSDAVVANTPPPPPTPAAQRR
jgi:hypothetical protein